MMGFVVKVIDQESGSSCWVAPYTSLGLRRIASREQARVFPTRSHAESEVEILRDLIGEKFQFEIEGD